MLPHIASRIYGVPLLIFLGTGQYDRAENLPDIAAARARASEMQAAANNGRGAMVYAISAEGRSVLVPSGYAPASTAVQRQRSK
jgi:hypothetical protein